MNEISSLLRDGVVELCAKTGVILTPEQREVVYNFNDSMAVFANPGTGKTTTAVIGLIAAQLFHKIKGKNINAMSFTRLATAELSARYKQACKKCGITSTVQFNTFHSICYSIIRKHYPNFQIRSNNTIEKELSDFKDFVATSGVKGCENMYLVRDIHRAMISLNNELLFSKSAVMSSSKFLKISNDVTLRQFQEIRAQWFRRNFLAQSITQNDIPLMVLFILYMYPEIAQELKNEYQLMLVDEFQDMSVLYLEVLSQISNKLIVIGDVKQQIYGFNGASLLILDFFKSIYTDAKILPLTQSFRCSNEVVKLANEVIAPNEIEGSEDFKGIKDGGTISIDKMDIKLFDSVIDHLKQQQDNKEFLDVMFLSRNNASVMPIIEKLYNSGVMFRTNKFSRVMDVPIFSELCLMADVALNSKDPQYVAKVNRFMPEFKFIPYQRNPLIEVMGISKRETDKDLLTMNYTFNTSSSVSIINNLRRFVELERQGQPFSVSCLPLLNIYEDFIIEGNWWKLEQSKDYYFKLVSSIISTKTYSELVYTENDKKSRNEYYSKIGEGVRCYTFHGSKGLEASSIYLLDVDDGIVPKTKTIDDLINIGCVLEAAKELRNERNLIYVAITRAKTNVSIFYQEELSRLISSPDKHAFSFLDKVWKEQAVLNNETKAFKILLGIK